MVHRIAQPGWEIIQAYAHMKLGDVEFACPYYRHTVVKGLGARVSIGKGFPEEILEETKALARVDRFDFANATAEDIRSFMVSKSVGIDCSGYIAHVLYAIHGNKLLRSLTDDSFGAMFLRFRPFQKINVHLLQTSGVRVAYQDAKPEDIIVTRGGRHAMVIFETERGEDGRLRLIRYTHSTSYFSFSGVRFGEIQIVDLSKPLEHQRWMEGDGNEENHTQRGYLEGLEKNGVYRLLNG